MDVILSRAALRGTTISGRIKGFVGNSSFENVAHRENVTAPLLLLPRGNADNFSFLQNSDSQKRDEIDSFVDESAFFDSTSQRKGVELWPVL